MPTACKAVCKADILTNILFYISEYILIAKKSVISRTLNPSPS